MTILMEKHYCEPAANSWGRGLLQGIGKRIENYVQLSQQRRALLEMDAHQLNDIGINRVKAVQLARPSCFSNRPLISNKK